MFSMKRSVLVLGLLSAPTIAEAQVCGTFADDADHLVQHREVFESAEWADVRAALGIETLDPDDPVELVTDTSTCTFLIDDEMNTHDVPGIPSPSGYAIYRYGSYYAIEYRPPPRQIGDMLYHASARLRIYTVGQGQKLKGTVQVE